MKQNVEDKILLQDIKQNFSEASWMFLGLGMLSFLSFLIAPVGTLAIQSAAHLTSYLRWANLIVSIAFLLLFFVFAFRHFNQFKFRLESIFFYLLGLMWVVVPVLHGISLLLSGFLKKASISFLITDAANAMGLTILAVILCLAGLVFHNRSMAGLGILFLVLYFVSLQVGDVVVFRHNLTQAGSLDASLKLTVDHFMMPLVNVLAYLVLGVYAKIQKNAQ